MQSGTNISTFVFMTTRQHDKYTTWNIVVITATIIAIIGVLIIYND